MTNIITCKVTYEGCENRIWRVLQISSNAYLSQLGYTILATFDTMAYHLFSIAYNDTIFELPDEDEEIVPEECLFCMKLADLELSVGNRMEMVYDFGCEQTFTIEVTDISPMPRGSGRAYPKIMMGEGCGIVDDLSADELLEIIHAIDEDGESSFYYEGKCPDVLWDYRKYDLIADNVLLKGEIENIADGYSAFEAYL